MNSFTGKLAVLTGGGSGMGREWCDQATGGSSSAMMRRRSTQRFAPNPRPRTIRRADQTRGTGTSVIRGIWELIAVTRSTDTRGDDVAAGGDDHGGAHDGRADDRRADDRIDLPDGRAHEGQPARAHRGSSGGTQGARKRSATRRCAEACARHADADASAQGRKWRNDLRARGLGKADE
jgi:hypothetical protein